jgi:hypothetical protein
MVWGLATAFAIMFALGGWIIDGVVASDEDLDSGNVEPYISFWASAAGTAIGAGTSCLLTGRPLPVASGPPVIEAEIAEAPPKV